jgi:hypothetical protein
MIHFVRKMLPRAAVVASLVAATPALADDSAQGEPPPKPSAPSPAAAPSPSAATPPSVADTTEPLLGIIARLGPGAYPSDPIRGIYGGSLWRTFHGLQWPYIPKTAIGVSGSIWLDTGYEHIARGNPTEQSIKYWVQQGRLVLRVTPTWSDGEWFTQAQAEFVANENQSQSPSSSPPQADVDDLWIKIGKWKTFDVQVGRYEAWEVYHFGMGLDLYTLERNGATDQNYSVPSVYGVTYAFYRPNSIGAAAVHLYPTPWLRFELGTRYGNETGQNGFAVRPVGVLDLGWMKFKVGAEYLDYKPQIEGSLNEQKEQGAGAALQFVVDPWVEFGINGAFGHQDQSDPQGHQSPTATFSTYSIGAFANVRIVEDLLVGAGINYTYLKDQQFDPTLGRDEDFDQWQGFGAVQYLLLKQLYIKGVFGYALADFNPNMTNLPFANRMVSGRLRLEYLF